MTDADQIETARRAVARGAAALRRVRAAMRQRPSNTFLKAQTGLADAARQLAAAAAEARR